MNNTNIELIALARKQVYDEYIEKSSTDLSEWLLKCDIAWKQNGIMLPYPKLSVYPEEEEIIERYKLLSAPKEPVATSIVKEEVKEEPKVVEEVKAEVIDSKPPNTFLQSLSIFGKKE